jgi:ribosomal protein S18 acetylase RimI-like enzyme
VLEDLFVRWAAEADGARVWRQPTAVIVSCANLAHWDRLVMSGDPEALAGLVREVLPEVGATFRPFGPEDLVAAVVERAPELTVTARFAWMETTAPVRRTSPAARWLSEDEWPEVTALLDESFPDSYARPGESGVHRWAGVRDTGGRLIAVAAEAWSTAEIGFLAGVTTRPDARGRGLAADLCGFATDDLLAGGRERVALLADYVNVAAVATYRKLGFSTRRVAAARRR